MPASGPATGTVFLVGAGPGDAGLITVRGAELLARADVVVADHLVSTSLLALAPASAERVVRGARRSGISQEGICALLVERARAGLRVVRLKGGDPFVFGRGGEEIEALRDAGVPYEVVPGVTAAVAASAYAGIPLTHRGVAGAVAFATGHEADKDAGHVAWESLATGATTLVLYMSLEHLGAAADKLVRAGRDPLTPAAVISDGTRPTQRTVVGTLADIAERAAAAHLTPPALTVIGEVVRLRDRLAWFENRPLHGARVLLTRPVELAPPTVSRLAALGAEVLSLPALRIAPPSSFAPLDDAIRRIDEHRLIALASQSAVAGFFARLELAGKDTRSLAGKIVAAVGERTAAALMGRGLRADVVALEMSGAGLGRALAAPALLEALRERGGSALLPRAEEGREELRSALAALGLTVEAVPAYRTLPVPLETFADARALLERDALDAILVGSPRAAEALVNELLPDRARYARAIVGAIGPTTEAALRALGVRVDVVAEPHTFDALVDALVPLLVARRSAA